MIRMIDGELFEVKRSETALELVARDLGDHREVVVQRPMEMCEFDAPETIKQWWREKLLKPKSKQELAEAEERNLARVQRRRKTECRRRVKVLGHDTLLTLTYKANQRDLALSWKHWKEFVRRVRRVLPGFSYVVAWERQKRGAWHAHLSTHALPRLLAARNGVKVKSFNVLRAIWRGVIGELGGNLDVSKRQRSAAVTQAHIASYLSKYMLKSSQSAGAGVNVWAASSCDMPAPLRLRFDGAELLEVIGLAHQHARIDGGELCSAWVAPWRDTIYLATERLRVDRSIHSAPKA